MSLTVDDIDWAAVSRDWAKRFKSGEECRRAVLDPWLPLIPPTCVLTTNGTIEPRLSKYLPETHRHPHERQLEFLKLADQDVFFGGGAGGGKSIALLMAAAQFLDVPGYTALVLRRTYSELSLPGALMDVANTWWPQYRRKDGKEYWFPIENGGTPARLVFGFLETIKDLDRYQSSEFHFIGIDEVTEFDESDFAFMWSRLRNPPQGVPLRMRCASNPNGKGRLWVKKRYVDKATRGERIFVPSLAKDNPYLRERDQYEENLATQLGPVRAAQLLRGDWEIQANGMFARQWFKVVDVVPAQMRYCRYWDLAGTEQTDDNDPDYTVGALVGQYGREFAIVDVRRARLTSKGVEDLILQTAKLDRETYGNVVIRMEQEPGASGLRVIDDYTRLLAGYDFKGDRVTGPKEIRACALAAQAERGNVVMLSGRWNADLLNEMEVFPGGGHDDICLAAKTMIETDNGPVPIERVKAGDMVLTRNGFKQVIWAGQTATARTITAAFSNGQVLTATPNHPVWTENKGFIRLDRITGVDNILSCQESTNPIQKYQKRLSITGLFIGGILTRLARLIGAIFQQQNEYVRARKFCCIGKYGVSFMGLFQKVVTFITRTEITSTIRQIIWNASHLKAISKSMLIGNHGILTQLRTTLVEFGNWLVLGTGALKAANGIVVTGQTLGRLERSKFINVGSAVTNLKVSCLIRSTVQPDATKDIAGNQVSAITLKHAKYAVKNSAVSVIKRLAHVNVVRVSAGTRLAEPVYNLTVKDSHEFFANGILVHNCDAVSGAFNYLTGVPPVNTRGIIMVGERLRPDW